MSFSYCNSLITWAKFTVGRKFRCAYMSYHPLMLPKPYLEIFQYWSIISALAVIWVHLQIHAWLKVNHLVSPRGRQLSCDFLKGHSPLRWHSISYMFYQSIEGTTQQPTIVRSHTALGLSPWMFHPQKYQTQLHILMSTASFSIIYGSVKQSLGANCVMWLSLWRHE